MRPVINEYLLKRLDFLLTPGSIQLNKVNVQKNLSASNEGNFYFVLFDYVTQVQKKKKLETFRVSWNGPYIIHKFYLHDLI